MEWSNAAPAQGERAGTTSGLVLRPSTFNLSRRIPLNPRIVVTGPAVVLKTIAPAPPWPLREGLEFAGNLQRGDHVTTYRGCVSEAQAGSADAETADVPDVAEVPELTEVPELDDTLRCAKCQHEVTAGRFAIEVDGAHAHTFRNPGGWSYRIGCYAEAGGAVPSGQATDEHTWFPGFAWRFAHCQGCSTHLGWWFVGPGRAFAGLILARLG